VLRVNLDTLSLLFYFILFGKVRSLMSNLSARERMKVACLHYAVSTGLDEEEMVRLFKTASYLLRHPDEEVRLKEAMTKEGGWLGTLGSLGLGGALLALLFGGVGTAATGNILGRTASNIYHGQAPSGDEFRLTDEIAAYKRNTDEVVARMKDNKEKEALRSKPSAHRMF
jgi:hypothetical protein